MHPPSSSTDIRKAFGPDKQHLTAQEPTAVLLLLRVHESGCVQRFLAFLLPAVGA